MEDGWSSVDGDRTHARCVHKGVLGKLEFDEGLGQGPSRRRSKPDASSCRFGRRRGGNQDGQIQMRCIGDRKALLGSTVGSFADQPSARSRQERELERCEHREQWRIDETDVCAAKNAQPFLVFHCYKKNLQTRP
jgi:hypothetical protein